MAALFLFLSLLLPGRAEQARVLRREVLRGPQGLLLDRGEARAPVPLQELAVDLAVFFLCVVVVVEMRN